jgi:hypothetical protein
MSVYQSIKDHKHDGKPFWIYLSDGRSFFIPTGDHISLHPSGQGHAVMIYGPGPDEDHYVPMYAITSVGFENAGDQSNRM